MISPLSLLIPTLLLSPSIQAYNLVKSYSGQSFFDEWTYISTDRDPWTNGDVVYLGHDQAGNLTRINAAGNAEIHVDDFTLLWGDPVFQKRPSIRLEGQQIFNQTNAVLVYDVLNVPYGCSLWGSLWTKSGISQWPQGGEVDIFEAVNKMAHNQMALHTKSTCKITSGGQTGSVINSDCQLYPPGADGLYGNTAGCTVSDPSTNSYSTFDSSGGGVWVAEYAATGVKIWFFQRSAVPSSLSGDTLDTSTLGTPTADFPNSDQCDFSQALDPQHMVIDITLCGDWAGTNQTLTDTGCGLTNTSKCYFQYAFDLNNYHGAYFEIASIKIFGDDTTLLQNGTQLTATPRPGPTSHISSPNNHVSTTRDASGNIVTGTSTATTSSSLASKFALWTPLAILAPALLATVMV